MACSTITFPRILGKSKIKKGSSKCKKKVLAKNSGTIQDSRQGFLVSHFFLETERNREKKEIDFCLLGSRYGCHSATGLSS